MAAVPPPEKFNKLVQLFRPHEKIAVAFSGGVDSTLTLYAAISALGVEKVVALHALSTFSSASAIAGARATFSKNFPATAVLKEIPVNPLFWPEVVTNGETRCYHCKTRMYTVFREAMAEEGCSVLADGTNADDLLEQRPGLRAIRELGVVTPLADVGLTKLEVRQIAENEGLTNYALPSNSCLATRIHPGKSISEKALKIVEEAENFLHARGFLGCRVKLREDCFQIEVQEKDLTALVQLGNREAIQGYLQKLQAVPVMLKLAGR